MDSSCKEIIIRSAQFVISAPRVQQCPSSTLPEYAFIGRSNVGKSSLINMLLSRHELARTSQTPGKTLLINHFLVETNYKWHLVDLPGYGYAQRGKQQRMELQELIDNYCLYREQLTSLFVLIDSRLAPQKIDLEFITWLAEHTIPFAIIFTKSDKLSTATLQTNIDTYKSELLHTWEELPPIFITSATRGRGRQEVLHYIEAINKEVSFPNATSPSINTINL